MANILNRLRGSIGEFWWYSLMLFVACRSGDVIQAFIGLWLVPKYVDQSELGAVLPLQQLCGFFAMPLTIIATVFTKYVNVFATRKEYGKLKSFAIDVLTVSSAIFLLCIVVAYILLPHFYKRLYVVSGSLTILILTSGFIGGVSGLLGSVVQGLKKFNVMTIQAIITSPIRLVTLFVAMPFRPLSGYLLGQTTPAATTGFLAALTIYHELHAAPIDKTWRKELPSILRYMAPFAICMIIGNIFGTISATVYRQRLPEVESAANYVLSRFSEIAGYVGTTMQVVLFPLAAEAHEKGKENPRILMHSILGTFATTVLLAGFFAFCSSWLLSLTTVWQQYADYAYLLPWLTIATGIGMSLSLVTSYEFAAKRFALPFALTAFGALETTLIVCFAGCSYFQGTLPAPIVNWMGSCHIARLSTLTYISIVAALIQLISVALVEWRRFKKTPRQQ